MNILLENIKLDLQNSELLFMRDNNIITFGRDGNYRISKDSEFRFLYDKKLPLSKKRKYLESMVQQNFTCQFCGKKHSYCIGPQIKEDGTVDFNQVICYCKTCRNDKLSKRKILKPIYKQNLNWKKEYQKMDQDIARYNIPKEKQEEYKELCSHIIALDRFSNLVLPIKDLSKIKIINKDVNLSSNLKERKKIKNYLYRECKQLCPVCGKHMIYKDFTIDHIIAKKIGGRDNLNNLIGMCSRCNSKKGHRSVLLFLSTKELNKMPPKLLKIAQEQQRIAKKRLIILLKEKELIEKGLVH